jgi:uncharacterized protein YndB with AHSA1/START domain
MTTAMSTKSTTTQVYCVYIKTTPQKVWDAITKPEWTDRYGYGGRVEYDLRPGGKYRHLTSEPMRAQGAPDVAVDGEVIESIAPRKLVQTWRMAMDPETAAEGFSRLTWEIEESQGGLTKLTVIHELEGTPKLALLVSGDQEHTGAGGGWNWILSDLKTLLETGKGFNEQ